MVARLALVVAAGVMCFAMGCGGPSNPQKQDDTEWGNREQRPSGSVYSAENGLTTADGAVPVGESDEAEE